MNVINNGQMIQHYCKPRLCFIKISVNLQFKLVVQNKTQNRTSSNIVKRKIISSTLSMVLTLFF